MFCDRDAVADEFLDVRQGYRVGLAAEADCVTRCASACGAADAVNVILTVLGQVVVDDAFHIRDVQAARCNIGTDQYLQFAALKTHQHAEAFFLWHVPRDCAGINVVRLQIGLHTLRLSFRIHEYHDTACAHPGQHAADRPRTT